MNIENTQARSSVASGWEACSGSTTVWRESTRLVPNDLGRVFGHYGPSLRSDLAWL